MRTSIERVTGMSPELIALLIQLGVQLARDIEPAVAALLVALLTKLTAAVSDDAQTELATSSLNIVAGLRDAHPDWTTDTIRAYAVDALAIRASELKIYDPPLVATLIELADTGHMTLLSEE